MILKRDIWKLRASSTYSALTLCEPCHTLVRINGIASMNTTKIVVAFEMPKTISANMAQIAADTVLTTDSTGSQN